MVQDKTLESLPQPIPGEHAAKESALKPETVEGERGRRISYSKSDFSCLIHPSDGDATHAVQL
jgi:hypothetical protein